MAVLSGSEATTALRNGTVRRPMAGARGHRPSWLQATLLIVGGTLLPVGLIVIGFGWYGAANTPYAFDQISYLISGGLLGLGLAFTGGFLYFGSWLAKIATDNSDAMNHLAETLAEMGEAISRAQVMVPVPVPQVHVPATSAHDRAETLPAVQSAQHQLVATEAGSMLHQAHCTLVRGRQDLRTASFDDPDLKPCRMCLAE